MISLKLKHSTSGSKTLLTIPTRNLKYLECDLKQINWRCKGQGQCEKYDVTDGRNEISKHFLIWWEIGEYNRRFINESLWGFEGSFELYTLCMYATHARSHSCMLVTTHTCVRSYKCTHACVNKKSRYERHFEIGFKEINAGSLTLTAVCCVCWICWWQAMWQAMWSASRTLCIADNLILRLKHAAYNKMMNIYRQNTAAASRFNV